MEEDQEKVLDEAKKKVKESSYYLRKAIDEACLREALRSANLMLQELRSTQLSPKNYQYIFMLIFDEMRNLETFIKEEYRRGRKMNTLYESVQYALNIIPRIYLLITVGSVYIQTHEIGATEILTDLLDLIKGIQLPQHGLFIRYYFLKMCKDRLPDKGSEFEGPGNDINNAINVIQQNLNEMNKLWTRMSMGNKEKSRRERERIDLKILVGENVHRLSSLDGVDLDVYKEKVFPQLIDIIVNSKDTISQQYLLECIIQVFPDEFHLDTLQTLLDVCTTKVDAKVDKKLIFIKLMDRLAEYACGQDNQLQQLTTNIDIYGLFKQNIDSMIQNFQTTEFKSVLDLQVTFLKFTLRCYKDNTEYVNQILKSNVAICEKQDQSDFDDDCQKSIVKFLTIPLETMSIQILTMNEFPNLMKYLPFPKRRQVATKIVSAVVSLKSKIENPEITQQFLHFISPLLKTEVDYVEIDEQEFAEEQTLVARSVHLVDNENPKVNWQILSLFIEKFKEGESKRQKYTIPATIFALFKVARQIKEQNISGVNYETLFDIIKDLIQIVQQHYPELALKLFLQLTFLINELDSEKKYDEYCYDVASQALQIYQDELGDSDQKLKALQQIIGTLNLLTCLSEENYDGLCTNTTQYSSKLLKKTDQCLEVLKCTHLFYNNNLKNDQTLSACVKKSVKLAGLCLKQSVKNVYLYVHILNKIFRFFSSSEVKVADAQDCINVIKENIDKIKGENDMEVELSVNYWKNTIEYIQNKIKEQVEAFTQLKF